MAVFPLKDLGLRAKIYLVFLAVMAAFVGLVLSVFYQMDRVKKLSVEVVPLSIQTNEYREAGVALEILSNKIDKLFVVAYAEDLTDAVSSIDEVLGIISSADSSSEESLSSRRILLEIKNNLIYLSKITPSEANIAEINDKRSSIYSGIAIVKQYIQKVSLQNIHGVQIVIDTQKKLISTMLWYMLFVSIGMLIFINFIAYFFTRSFVKGVVLLRDTAKEIGGGNLAIKIRVDSKDEIGQLALVFNEMAAKLKESYGSLNEKVVERTKDLEVAKIELSKKLDEVEKMNKLMVFRELKMIELKKEVERLSVQKS